jgi:hypothetical protein
VFGKIHDGWSENLAEKWTKIKSPLLLVRLDSS